ncbi:hypothetical protein Tco_1240356 [Tanacetum coccineum]
MYQFSNDSFRGPYEFKVFTPSETEAPRIQKEEDLRGDDLKHYEAEIEAMNLILISIPNDIYNYVDACTTAKAMWQRVEREALVSVYNRFAQLMNVLERNGIIFPKVTINTMFLNCLQLEWLKYVTQVCLAKRLTGDSSNLLEDIQCAGSDTRPPMLDRTDFASWQQRIRLYCREGNKGALHLGPEGPRVYSDLSPEDKERYNADIRATNILLQGLPKDIYSLINHYTNAKDIWDNVKMLLEGSELTKEDCESQLYDDFEHFRQYKGETIHDYYVWFAKLINDMRNIKMTMSRMQLNSKFVNNMLPE